MKKFISIIIFAGLLSIINAQWPFGKDVQWYIDGPKKEWTERDHDRYYRWRDRLYRGRAVSYTHLTLPTKRIV